MESSAQRQPAEPVVEKPHEDVSYRAQDPGAAASRFRRCDADGVRRGFLGRWRQRRLINRRLVASRGDPRRSRGRFATIASVSFYLHRR